MKKIISLTLALVMLASLSLTCLAITPEDAARDLGKYGIMGGFPDGTLKLEKTVTRAEMTKMLTTALEFPNDDMGFAPFWDVASNYWAKNYIHYASLRQIIGGYPDGSFKPENNVTTCQAIKMVVCMLQYDKYYTDGGFSKDLSYPRDYLNIAHKYGLTDTPFVEDVPATRGYVASLLSRALDLPIVKQSGIIGGKDVYEILDGKDGKELKTLRTQLEN